MSITIIINQWVLYFKTWILSLELHAQWGILIFKVFSPGFLLLMIIYPGAAHLQKRYPSPCSVDSSCTHSVGSDFCLVSIYRNIPKNCHVIVFKHWFGLCGKIPRRNRLYQSNDWKNDIDRSKSDSVTTNTCSFEPFIPSISLILYLSKLDVSRQL